MDEFRHVSWECPRCGKSGVVDLDALGPLGAVRCTCGTASRPYRDPRWESVRGGISYDDTHPGVPKVVIEVKAHGNTVGHAFYLDVDHHLPRVLDKMVKKIDEVLHA